MRNGQSDIFKFWARIRPNDHIHPADKEVFSRVKKRHGFDLRCLPAAFFGPLRTARVVLLYLSPGWSDADVSEARSKGGRNHYRKMRSGRQPLRKNVWVTARTKDFGAWEDIRSKVAVLNIGAYHSKEFHDDPLLAALPSSRVSLDWAQRVLFPQAISGRRVVICLRKAHFWGLDEGRYGRALFVPKVNRAGHMIRGPKRAEVIRAVRRQLAKSR